MGPHIRFITKRLWLVGALAVLLNACESRRNDFPESTETGTGASAEGNTKSPEKLSTRSPSSWPEVVESTAKFYRDMLDRKTVYVRRGADTVLVELVQFATQTVKSRNGNTNTLEMSRDSTGPASESEPVVEEDRELAEFIRREELPSTTFEGNLYYVVEGHRLLDPDELRQYMVRKQAERAAVAGRNITPVNTSHALMIAKTAAGKRIIWTGSNTIRYCIASDVIGNDINRAQYNNIASWLRQAGADWSRVCNIKFEHVVARDGVSPGAVPPPGVDFIVRLVGNTEPYVADAFFPDGQRYRYKLKINPEMFKQQPYSKVGVMRHELGHILGFLHEHMHPLAPVYCRGLYPPESLPAFTQTPGGYDGRSVMHYPCNLKEYAEFAITPEDAAGAAELYPRR